MLDQMYSLEILVAERQERYRADARKHALRIRHRSRLINRYRD